MSTRELYSVPAAGGTVGANSCRCRGMAHVRSAAAARQPPGAVRPLNLSDGLAEPLETLVSFHL